MQNINAPKITKLEAAALAVLAKGMDRPGEGWFDQLKWPEGGYLSTSHTDRAVLGSLVKKGLATSYHDWVELTALGETICPEGEWEGRFKFNA